MSNKKLASLLPEFLILLIALVPLGHAESKRTDHFNRPDGPPGFGWSVWGAGAQINSDRLETFGEIDVAGGIARTLRVPFPIAFSFDFSTNTPLDGGWLVGFNALAENIIVAEDTSEIELRQASGSRALCTVFQTAEGPSEECAKPVDGQRDYTAMAHITGLIKDDFSALVKIRYNDGQIPAVVTIRTNAPVDAVKEPEGSIFWFGNMNESTGPHFFDNISLISK